MVGPFYAAPNPDSDPFVKVGDRVVQGQVLCIIEAMKIFNEITAERAGTIKEIKVKAGDTVGSGDVVTVIE